tara:strand:- start:3298 stop:3657 length:360 start_codon:yes stop_codon:yes gene_type:complete
MYLFFIKEFTLMNISTKKWLFLKISSLIQIPLMFWFVLNLASFYDKSFQEVLSFFTSQPSKFLFSILIITAFFHSALSISEIFEDYMQDEKMKNVANKILIVSAIIIPILTIFVISKLL